MPTASTPFTPPTHPPPSDGPRPGQLTDRSRALFVAVAFVIAATLTRFIVECLGGALAVGALLATDPTVDLTDPSAIPTAVTAGLTIIDLVLLGGLSLGFAWLVPPLKRTMGFSAGTLTVYPLAVAGGLFVGAAFGWFGEILRNIIPSGLQLSTLDMISNALLEGPWFGRILMVLAVTLAAPILEELVFRGALWGALDRALPTPVVWLLTSAAFALFHLDPIHVILVFPVGLMIGWMRLVSGSIWPCMLLHFVNNTLAVVLVYALDPTFEFPWWAALIAGFITLVVFALGLVLRKKDPA